MKLRSIGLGILAASAIALFGATAGADGNGTHGQTLVKRGKGVNAASFGVGLSTRNAGAGPPAPVTTGTITIAALPAGAVITNAYLYWMTYGTAGNASMTLDGTVLTGAAIGTAPGTCWEDDIATGIAYSTFSNFAFRADVTAMVTGNGAHTLTGFPSGTATADTHGASIFVVYTDPAATNGGHVLLYDGAATLSSTSRVNITLGNIQPPATISSARFLVAAGDGEVVLADGLLRFAGTPLPAPPPGGQHFRQSAGPYWDDRNYDVSTLLDSTQTSVTWSTNYAADCLTFPFSAITIQSPTVPDAPDAGDGGSSGSSGGSSGSSGGSSGGSGAPGSSGASGDAPDAGSGVGGSAGNAAPEDASGCACRAVGPAATSIGAFAALLAATVLFVRRRRR
ncbi:MAG: DUF3344 domain-containing protein [Deltaproteobacteria bacterium]|nr:DUF3344 domain-containing protein [Deltaproteobacteria bacterium]